MGRTLRRVFWSALTFLATYIVAPIIVFFSTNGVDGTSPGGRILSAIYPAPIAEQVVERAPIPTSPAPATSSTGIAQVSIPPSVASTGASRMTVTPAHAALTASLHAPTLRSGQRIDISLDLTSAIDALPVFAGDDGSLEGWSATILPRNVSCYGGVRELSGLNSYSGDDWRRAASQITVLPADKPVSVSGEFVCNGDVQPGDAIRAAIRLYYNRADERIAVTFYSDPLVVRRR